MPSTNKSHSGSISLKDIITEEVDGIVWIDEQGLKKGGLLYQEMDYLFDQLLTQHLDNNADSSPTMLIHKNFDHPLFLIFVKNESELQKFSKAIPSTFRHKKAVVLSKNPSKDTQALKKVLTDWSFTAFDLNKI